MYSFDDTNIDTIITESIYKDITQIVQSDIKNANIVDYFPEEITKNFTLTFVGNPSKGTTSKEIDAETRTITWNIGTLQGNEVATLKYKLKIKDMQNANLLNKTIATNR